MSIQINFRAGSGIGGTLASSGVLSSGPAKPSITVLDGVQLPSNSLANQSLAGLNLTAADLSGQDLRNVNFTGANLTNADLSYANCAGAIFTSANQTGTIFTGTRFV